MLAVTGMISIHSLTVCSLCLHNNKRHAQLVNIIGYLMIRRQDLSVTRSTTATAAARALYIPFVLHLRLWYPADTCRLKIGFLRLDAA